MGKIRFEEDLTRFMVPISSYSKPFKTLREQVDLLKSRGMVIANAQEAENYLRNIGYYRLSGYWYPFRQMEQTASGSNMRSKRADVFVSGTNITDVIALYEFDRKLRLLVSEAIEKIEIHMRFQIGNTLGKYNQFAHTDPQYLDTDFVEKGKHISWLHDLINVKQKRSHKEDFSKHFTSTYSGFMPIWMATEIFDFGCLSILYNGMRQKDKDHIAKNLKIIDNSNNGGSATLSNWIENFRVIRNICAHHSRLWNKTIPTSLASTHIERICKVYKQHYNQDHLLNHLIITQNAQKNNSQNDIFKHIYPTLATLAWFIKQIEPNATWHVDIKNHVQNIPQPQVLNSIVSTMGFPSQWENEPIWN